MTPDAVPLHHRARSLLPPEVYDYYAGGSGPEGEVATAAAAARAGAQTQVAGITRPWRGHTRGHTVEP